MEKPFLSVIEVGEILGVGDKRVYQLVHQGVVPSIRLTEHTIKIPRAAFEEWIARQSAIALSQTNLIKEESATYEATG